MNAQPQTQAQAKEPFKFPTYIKTKRLALEVANEIFPPAPHNYSSWLVQTDVITQHLRLHALQDRLRAMLEWLYDDDGRMRVYMRPRWHFFYQVAQNLFWNIDDARDLIDQSLNRERWAKERANVQAANIMNGDGQGI